MNDCTMIELRLESFCRYELMMEIVRSSGNEDAFGSSYVTSDSIMLSFLSDVGDDCRPWSAEDITEVAYR